MRPWWIGDVQEGVSSRQRKDAYLQDADHTRDVLYRSVLTRNIQLAKYRT